MVLAHGNAPGSIGYRPIALLLSYTRKLAESGGLAPQPAMPIQLFSKQRPHLGGFTPQEKWRRAVVLPHRPRGPKRLPTDHRTSRFYSPEKWRRREVMLPSGARPPGPVQTGAGASAGFASESPPGRICTCVDPLRRRRPELLGHGEWTSRRDSHPQHGVRRAA